MSLDESVRQLCARAVELNSLTDRLNQKAADIQRQLTKAGVGIELWLQEPIEVPGDDPVFLGWMHLDGWGLAVGRADINGGHTWESLLGSTRATRIAAFPHLGRLIDKLLTEVTASLEAFGPLRGELSGVSISDSDDQLRTSRRRERPPQPRPQEVPPPLGDDDIPF